MKLTLHVRTIPHCLVIPKLIINNSDKFVEIVHATLARGDAMPDAIKNCSMSGGRPMASRSLEFVCFMMPAL